MQNALTKKGRKVIVFGDPPGGLMYDRSIYKEIQIPCGQCMECRLAYRRQWATRIMLEKKEHEHSYFITLTYDPEHEHTIPILDQETGELTEHSNLSKTDLQLFMKEYRRKVKTRRGEAVPHDYGKCRFFACGEYGENTSRRHLHIIMFQEKPLDDLQYLKLTRDHNVLYISRKLDAIWGHGQCFVGEVTLESRGYVRRYVTKKLKGDAAEAYNQLGIEPEFVQMSRKPGIGMKYFESNKDKIYHFDSVIIPNMKGEPQTLKPARLFDEKFWEEEPVLMQSIKDKRREIAIAQREAKLARTDLNTYQYGKVEQRARESRQKTLKRGDV